jgi:electron transport complex protein RnfG
MNKDMLKLGAILLVITAVCAGLLSTVSNITKPIVAAEKEKSEKIAMQALLPSAKDFSPYTLTEDGAIKKVYAGYTEPGNADSYVGAVVTVASEGYGGTVELLVGIDETCHITGIQVLSHSETPGLGANAEKDSFRSQFEGKKAPLTVTKTTPGDVEIQAITGATITSNAVVLAVNTVSDYVNVHQNAIKEGGIK